MMATPTGSSTPTGSTLTDQKREELRKKIRERMSKSKLDVKGPEGWTAYWARKDDASELARLDYLGFRVVHEKADGNRYTAQGRREDGTYCMGDVILMEIPTDEWDIMCEENAERSRNQATSAKQRFLDEAAAKGSPTFKVNR
jgi:hypothetical protein